jgi:hypothetical protein
VKNFVLGLLIGWVAAYWYYTQRDYVRDVASVFWTRASSAPPAERP